MSASNEWTEWHLTPAGWVIGTEKTDFNRVDRDPPADRVLTTVYEEFLGAVYGKPHRGSSELWRSPDTEAVDALIEKFGPAPTRL